ncbi:MAG: dephospho-CoA kinase [Treponema sp.]|jgi:dephospho-CoA kinase|nr:dephospho-CoA kinase [Treponema sp.]
MLIGLTGTYCAGKNYLAALLKQRGLPVLDVDKLGYTALDAEKEALAVRFGGDIMRPDGTVDRRLLGEKVFGKSEELAALEAIVHPAANRLTEEWIESMKGKTCVINAALLHRSSVFGRLDCIILVGAPFLTRLLRARRRDALPWSALFKRFASQKDFTTQYLAGKADIYRVENHGFSAAAFRRSRAKLERRIDAILFQVGLRQ